MIWRRLGALRGTKVDERRWIVLDVESSGLDPARDRLLAIAAVGLHRGEASKAPRIAFGDSFEAVLRQAPQPQIDRENILLHGIGAHAQQHGIAPGPALESFERWVAGAPLIGFHVGFDEALIQRTMATTLGRRLAGPWLDLARVAHAVRPDVPAHTLDEWMDALAIRCARRHQAAADTLATAELMLKLWPGVVAQRAAGGWRPLARLAAASRWLPG
jgi:DNA polymerase-3 subunit epsilon